MEGTRRLQKSFASSTSSFTAHLIAQQKALAGVVNVRLPALVLKIAEGKLGQNGLFNSRGTARRNF